MHLLPDNAIRQELLQGNQVTHPQKILKNLTSFSSTVNTSMYVFKSSVEETKKIIEEHLFMQKR